MTHFIYNLKDDARQTAILFLTNRKNTLSNKIALSLLYWLRDVKKENIIYFEDEITPEFILENNINFVISYNYTFIIKPEVINLLSNKIVNLHISYLPYNKGANPNIWSFIENTPCGITIHEIDSGIDSGDILLQELIDFDYDKDTFETSYVKSHEKIQDLFCKNWDKIKNGEIEPKKQGHKGTFHLVKDLDKYKGIIDSKDTINAFLEKINKANCSPIT